MGSDFYTDDYAYGGGDSGGYYDGGGMDYGFDTTSWPTFESYYGNGGLPPDYAPGFGPETGFLDLGGGYVYDPSTEGVLDTGLWQGFDNNDLFQTFLDDYIALGYDALTAAEFAAQEVEATTQIPTFEQGSLPAANLPSLPMEPYNNYWALPYIPSFPESPAPAPPLPSSPASSQPNLPPACPGGQYHPYPIGHPNQNQCVPFPTQSAPQAQQKPSGQQSGSSGGASKPQQQPKQQQACPTGYYRATNGQCLPIPRCTTPGTVLDQATGRCVPRGQAISPLPGEAEDLLSNLKDIPWWVWLALGGAFLLSRDSDGKTTTVRYRRAS